MEASYRYSHGVMFLKYAKNRWFLRLSLLTNFSNFCQSGTVWLYVAKLLKYVTKSLFCDMKSLSQHRGINY